MSIARHHTEWLSLVEVSGPFLSLPVLLRVFPQGLDAHDPEVSRSVRRAYEEWADNQQGLRPDPAVHTAWVRFVLRDVLGFPDELLAAGPAIPEALKVTLAEHGETLRPDLVIQRDGQAARILVQIVPPGQDLDRPLSDRRWKASPATRMAELLRGSGVRLGLVTNGERWMLVHAQPGETASFISWYASLWTDEPVTLRAFRSLLGIDRTFGVPERDTLEALLAESAANQQEVTDQLGDQVREAVEVLVQTLDRIDKDQGRRLLAGIAEPMLYEAALTVMMRLVFLFSAEERGLLLLGKPIYDQHYAVSTLRAQLRAVADQAGEEVLERRFDAWSRLLATFRAVFGGVQHEDLRLPAYGGELFDPDRFPFLEGRAAGSNWRATPAQPVPVDNRTVLHLLEALQILRVRVPGGGPAEPRRLSFRALDIEQIGHVYEGLLDHTARRAAEPVLGLAGAKDRDPEVPLVELERHAGIARPKTPAPAMRDMFADTSPASDALHQNQALIAFLEEATGRSRSALTKALAAPLETRELDALRAACDNDVALAARVQPFAGLLRRDTFGRPVVITAGSVYVTGGTDRRSSGTHYTPRSLTEPIVQHTLDPLVYHGPAEGLPKEQWTLHSAERILSLQVCDLAMGSGAFLVQACRYLSERLIEAWEREESLGVWGIGDRVSGVGGGGDGAAILPRFGGLAEEHGSGRGDLSADQNVSEGGAVRADEPDPARGGLGSGEHRRGLRAETPQGVSEPSVDRPRLAPGSGDASPDRGAAGLPGPRTGGDRLDTDAGDRQDAAPSHPIAHRPITNPYPIPYSLSPLATTRDPEERLALARRLVADRCLYGVDKNPLAVEMTKLSLWLITLQKDRPFSFLDHALRCGDSLLGIADVDQLLRWSLARETGPTTATFLTAPLGRALERALSLRRKIRETQVRDVRDAERKAVWLREAEEALGLVRLAADLLVAAALHKDKKRREELSAEFQYRMSLAAEAWETVLLNPTVRPGANQEALAELRREADDLLERRRPFHWPLEFPEVFTEGSGYGVSGIGYGREDQADELTNLLGSVQNNTLSPIPHTLDPGFAAIVGNPPFQGGQKITGTLGVPYRDYLVEYLANGKRGSADLCAYFFLRAGRVLRGGGQAGLIATNTIAQGDTREVGLDQLVSSGFVIPRAVSSRPWPGLAAVEVAHVWIRHGKWHGLFALDEQPVVKISPYLTVLSTNVSAPSPLKENENISFIGSYVLGMGFILTMDEARCLIESDPRNREVIFPYLNGEDLNSRPDQSPSRWVINFHNWPLEQAQTYLEPFRVLMEKVRPERQKNNRKVYRDYWWQYAEKRPALYAAIENMKRMLVIPRVSKYLTCSWRATKEIPSEATVVIASEEDEIFCVLQCVFHEEWVRSQGSTLETRMRYTPSDCLETFPFPRSLKDSKSVKQTSNIPNSKFNTLNVISKLYYEHRQRVMLQDQEGLTKIYNRFHDSAETSDNIVELRRLHVEMDQAVAVAYGWDDLVLDHGFHQTKQGLRYTISEAARRIVLDRLLALNHQRYAEEVAQGLHDKGEKKAVGRGTKGRKGKNASEQDEQQRLL